MSTSAEIVSQVAATATAAVTEKRDPEYYGTGSAGNTAFWLGFGIFTCFSALFLFSLVSAKTEKVRKFSVANLVINTIASLAYLSMALNQGVVARGTPGGWLVYYARYIDWTFTTPLLLLDLANLSGAPMSITYTCIFYDIVMIIAGLFASLSTESSSLWLWFTLACIAFLPIYFLTISEFPKYQNPQVTSAYTNCAYYLCIVWTLYPILWILGEGMESISNDAQTIGYLFLDVTSKCVFGSMIVFLYRELLQYSEGAISDLLNTIGDETTAESKLLQGRSYGSVAKPYQS